MQNFVENEELFFMILSSKGDTKKKRKIHELPEFDIIVLKVVLGRF